MFCFIFDIHHIFTCDDQSINELISGASWNTYFSIRLWQYVFLLELKFKNCILIPTRGWEVSVKIDNTVSTITRHYFLNLYWNFKHNWKMKSFTVTFRQNKDTASIFTGWWVIRRKLVSNINLMQRNNVDGHFKNWWFSFRQVKNGSCKLLVSFISPAGITCNSIGSPKNISAKVDKVKRWQATSSWSIRYPTLKTKKVDLGNWRWKTCAASRNKSGNCSNSSYAIRSISSWWISFKYHHFASANK